MKIYCALLVLFAVVLLWDRKKISKLKKELWQSGEREKGLKEYAGNAAHELKSPLAAMKVLADSLTGSKEVPIELYREFMQDISLQIDRENRIIEDLMTLAGMEGVAGRLRVSSVNVSELVAGILNFLIPIAGQRKISVSCECDPDLVIETDENRLSDIVTNLAENAIKYNREHGWVKIRAFQREDYFYLEVSDSGIGIAQSEQEKVFQRFYRVDKQHSREAGGTGLGLSICRQAVRLLGGEIQLESREGKGSTFAVRLPLKPLQEEE